MFCKSVKSFAFPTKNLKKKVHSSVLDYILCYVWSGSDIISNKFSGLVRLLLLLLGFVMIMHKIFPEDVFAYYMRLFFFLTAYLDIL